MCDPETQKLLTVANSKTNLGTLNIYNKQTKPWRIPSTVANRQHGLALLKVDIFPPPPSPPPSSYPVSCLRHFLAQWSRNINSTRVADRSFPHSLPF